jgi:nucleotide-binding universal stress UspA family protein
MKNIQRIMVPTDCSAGAGAAADVAAQLARQLNASIDVVTVVDTSAFAEIYGDAVYRAQRIADIHSEAQTNARQFADAHLGGIARVQVHVRDGNTFLEICEGARELGSDMIVMGTHGRTGLAHLVIGSVAEKVVRASTIPVLTVRAPQEGM